MFTTIAWATDGSASASDALPIAEGLTRAIGGKLMIIHVQEVTISRSGFLTEDNRAVLASLHRTARRLQDGGIPATVLSSRTTTRNVPRKILDLVSSAHADVLVIGNRGHGSLINLLLGSVAVRLLQAAPLPIITVPSRSTAATQPTDAGIASDSVLSGAHPALPGQPLSHLRANSASHLDTRNPDTRTRTMDIAVDTRLAADHSSSLLDVAEPSRPTPRRSRGVQAEAHTDHANQEAPHGRAQRRRRAEHAVESATVGSNEQVVHDVAVNDDQDSAPPQQGEFHAELEASCGSGHRAANRS